MNKITEDKVSNLFFKIDLASNLSRKKFGSSDFLAQKNKSDANYTN
jgi:hypothetical protein